MWERSVSSSCFAWCIRLLLSGHKPVLPWTGRGLCTDGESMLNPWKCIHLCLWRCCCPWRKQQAQKNEIIPNRSANANDAKCMCAAKEDKVFGKANRLKLPAWWIDAFFRTAFVTSLFVLLFRCRTLVLTRCFCAHIEELSTRTGGNNNPHTLGVMSHA